jgi:hypothetical protein
MRMHYGVFQLAIVTHDMIKDKNAIVLLYPISYIHHLPHLNLLSSSTCRRYDGLSSNLEPDPLPRRSQNDQPKSTSQTLGALSLPAKSWNRFVMSLPLKLSSPSHLFIREKLWCNMGTDPPAICDTIWLLRPFLLQGLFHRPTRATLMAP